MQDAVLMGVLDRLGDGSNIGRCAPGRERPMTHEFGKILALDKFQRKKMAAIVFTGFEYGHDARVPQPGNDFGFITEPADEVRTGEGAVQQDFQGHDAV